MFHTVSHHGKPQEDTTTHQNSYHFQKSTTPIISKVVEQLEFLYIIGGNVKLCNHFEGGGLVASYNTNHTRDLHPSKFHLREMKKYVRAKI